MDIAEKVDYLLRLGTNAEIEDFLRHLPPELGDDEHVRQHVVILHDKVDAVDPLVSGHVFWNRSKKTVLLEQHPIGNVISTIQIGSVLESSGADYVVGVCGESLNPSTFPLGGLLQHISQLEGAAFFESMKDLTSLQLFEIHEQPSLRRDYRYLFINLGETNQCPRVCTLQDVADAYTKILKYVANKSDGHVVAFPILGWRSLSDEDRGNVASTIIETIKSFCKQEKTGRLREIRLCLYTLEASFHFAQAVGLSRQEKIHELVVEKESLRDVIGEQTNLLYDFGSPAFRNALQEVDQFVRSDISITFIGETGVGKTYFAKYIHEQSPRRTQPFISIACNEYSSDLLLAHLWGWKKGAFTSASSNYIGRVNLADRGTLFIDEIDKMSMDAQKALLQFIDSKEVHVMGDKIAKKVNVRLLFASIEPLDELVAHGKMLIDFYHRIVPPQIMLPPLRQRKEDILPMACMWLRIYARQYNMPNLVKFDAEVQKLLLSHPWPGNVRELQRTIEASVLRASGDTVSLASMLFAPQVSMSEHAELKTMGDLEKHQYETERSFYQSKLTECCGNVSETARRLGIPPKTLHSRLKELNLP